MVFIWESAYSVKVKEIDDQHKRLVKIMNSLSEAISNGKEKSVLGGLLDELISYSEYHFDTEEKYFDKFNYTNSKKHKKEHIKFKKKMLELHSKFKDDETVVSISLMNFLEDWLVTHLLEQDQEYVECFISNGLS